MLKMNAVNHDMSKIDLANCASLKEYDVFEKVIEYC